MKVLKDKQLGPWCSFCEPKTTRATHRQDGFGGKHCCADHKPQLLEIERSNALREGRMTEADHQTWGRL